MAGNNDKEKNLSCSSREFFPLNMFDERLVKYAYVKFIVIMEHTCKEI